MSVVPAEAEMFQCAVPIVQYPQGNLEAAPLTLGLWYGVILQDLDDVPAVHPVEMFPQYAYGKG